MRVCDVVGCQKEHQAKGLCSNHYMQKRKRDNPEYRIRQLACGARWAKKNLRRVAGIARLRRARRFRDPKIFLGYKYSNMLRRVRTPKPQDRIYYKNLPIMSRAEFIDLSLADADFQRLFKTWQAARYELRMTPVPDRIDSDSGYVWKNIEWVTFSENCRRAAELTNNRRAA